MEETEHPYLCRASQSYPRHHLFQLLPSKVIQITQNLDYKSQTELFPSAKSTLTYIKSTE